MSPHASESPASESPAAPDIPQRAPQNQGPDASLSAFARAQLAQIDAAGQLRSLVTTRRDMASASPIVHRAGRTLISFSCNDYLGLATHPQIRAAARRAIAAHGTGARASRFVTGNHPLLGALESALAAAKATEAATLFGTGYLANLGVITALMGPSDTILLDALAHSCLLTGARASGARFRRFHHNDLDHLAECLRAARARPGRLLIATESVFSMDGDCAPIPEILALAEAHDAWLLVDDAHGFGILPPGPPVPLAMGTLSKALASQGGYVCATAPVVRLLHHRAASQIYSTALPPASAAAALAALRIAKAEPERGARALAHARRFARLAGLPPPSSQIVPVRLGGEHAALAAAARLEAAGFLAIAIRPPTVPAGTARLRLAFTAAHRDEEIDRLADLVRAL